MRVCADSHAEPVAVAPVPEVVERTLSRPSPVGDLAVAVPRALECAFGDPVHPGDTGVIGLCLCGGSAPAFEDRPPATRPIRDRPLRIEPQLERVAGDVIGVQPGCRLEVPLPGCDVLSGPPEDEVEICVQPGIPRDSDRSRAVLRLVGPPECAQASRVEALRAERETRESEREPGLEPGPIKGGRVRLERDLARPKDERATERVAEHRDLRGLEQARRAATEKERARSWTAEERSLPRNLAPERVEVARAERGRGGRGGEIAVRAARSAERDVYIQADPLSHRVTPRGLGSTASADSSAVRPRSRSHSRDSWTKARRWLGCQSLSVAMRSSPKSGRSNT